MSRIIGRITYEQVEKLLNNKYNGAYKDYLDEKYEKTLMRKKKVIEDIMSIVNDGKVYKPRGTTEEFRIPEDISTEVAMDFFGVNAYDRNPNKITYKQAAEKVGSPFGEPEDSWIIRDVLLIVNEGKRYEPRGNTEEFRIVEDASTDVAKYSFGVNPYSEKIE